MGMGDNIGNWYYPPGDSPDGSTLVPTSDPNNTVPYQSLKCTNQIGLMVHGDMSNNQGIVRCTTTITGLKRHSNHMVVYSDNVFNNYSESYYSILITILKKFYIFLIRWAYGKQINEIVYTLVKEY